MTFEHYLAWTLGALINLVNARLEEAGAGFRLPTALGWHIRHGVDTPHALHLLNRGITSRRLAHRIGQASGFYRLKDLRDHLATFTSNAGETTSAPAPMRSANSWSTCATAGH